MTVFKNNWLTEPPHDYELKYYRLMDGIKKIKALISSNMLYSAILVVENELEKLYNIKYGRDAIESKTRVITGIDLDTMSLSYANQDKDGDLDVMYDMCNISIEHLEKLYRTIRDKWRSLESKCNITEIPDKKHLNTKGYIMYIEPKSPKIQIYSYVEPSSFKIDWNKFKLEHVSEIDNNLRSIATFIANSETQSNEFRFFRFDVKIDSKIPPHEECMIPLMKYCLFNRIKHGI
jgi:uncharacterized protein YaaR (DUF327 family)